MTHTFARVQDMSTSSPDVVAADRPIASPAVASARAQARLRAAVIVALLVPALLFVAVAWYLHRQAFEDARQRLDAAASVAREHALKLFETNEMLLLNYRPGPGVKGGDAGLAGGGTLRPGGGGVGGGDGRGGGG